MSARQYTDKDYLFLSTMLIARASTFISDDDEKSIKEKCKYVLENGLLGLMYWEHSCDPTGELLKAIYEGLR